MGHLWTYRDVTEERRVEARRHEAEKLQAVGRLAGGVAHDFNNLLAVIQGNAALLAEQVEPPAARQVAEEVVHASVRAADLVRQLLRCGRKEMLRPEVLDLSQKVAGLVPLLSRTVGESIAVRLDLAPNLPGCRADVGAVEHILVTLALNAREAMPAGGSIVLSTTCVDLSSRSDLPEPARPGRFIRLEVQDSGCGVPAHLLPRVFEPFFTTKEVGKGSGLGLPSVLGTAQQHGGWAELESQVGVGTRVRVYLPAADATPAPGRTAPPPGRLGRDRSVLVVEDEPVLLRLLERVLAGAGFRVHSASSGVQALALSPAILSTLDLVVTDVLMPGGVDGHQLARRLRAQRPGLPVLLCSGYSPELERTVDPAAPPLLAKPFSPTELLAAVEKVLWLAPPSRS